MSKVFQHKLAYKCNSFKELQEIYKELEKLGYSSSEAVYNEYTKQYTYIHTNWNNISNCVGFGSSSYKELIDSKELFLALAAQVEGKEYHVGEYVVSESYNKVDKISRIIEMDYSAHYHIVTELEPNNKWNQNHSSIRKATKEEIQDFIIPKQTIKEVKEYTFKIGDKVLIKERNIASSNQSGDIGTIISFGISSKSIQVQVEGRENYANYENADKLELVVKDTNSDKQYVECTHSETDSYTVGKHYEILKKDSEKITIKESNNASKKNHNVPYDGGLWKFKDVVVEVKTIFNTWNKGDVIEFDGRTTFNWYAPDWGLNLSDSKTAFNNSKTSPYKAIKSDWFKGEEWLYFERNVECFNPFMIRKSELIQAGLIKENKTIINTEMNKVFKNAITVKGSTTLLKAFAEELELLGYTNCTGRTTGKYIITYENGSYGFYIHDGSNKTYTIPTQWDEALKAASEKVITELVPVVGKWYVYIPYGTNTIINWSGDDHGNYGFWVGDWRTDLTSFGGYYPAKDWREATKEEVEVLLLKEATRLGFKVGVKYKSADDNTTQVLKKHGNFESYDDSLTDGYGGYVYYKGKWATIVPSEPEVTINGYKATYNKDSVKFGCNEIPLTFIKEVHRLQTEQALDFSSYKEQIAQIVKHYNSK